MADTLNKDQCNAGSESTTITAFCDPVDKMQSESENKDGESGSISPIP